MELRADGVFIACFSSRRLRSVCVDAGFIIDDGLQSTSGDLLAVNGAVTDSGLAITGTLGPLSNKPANLKCNLEIKIPIIT